MFMTYITMYVLWENVIFGVAHLGCVTDSCFYIHVFAHVHHNAYCMCSHIINSNIRFNDKVLISGSLQFNLLIYT